MKGNPVSPASYKLQYCKMDQLSHIYFIYTMACKLDQWCVILTSGSNHTPYCGSIYRLITRYNSTCRKIVAISLSIVDYSTSVILSNVPVFILN